MLLKEQCKVLCQQIIPAGGENRPSDGEFINEKILQSYSMNWLIDGLPAARTRTDPQTDEKFYSVGFELGSVDNDRTPYLNNHYDIIVEFHVFPHVVGMGFDGRLLRRINIVLSELLFSLRVRRPFLIIRIVQLRAP